MQAYDTVFGDEPAQRGVNYWFYDAGAGMFRIIFFSSNGNFSDEGNHYEGEIADGTVSVAWWLRGEDAAWHPWMRNTFTRTDG